MQVDGDGDTCKLVTVYELKQDTSHHYFLVKAL